MRIWIRNLSCANTSELRQLRSVADSVKDLVDKRRLLEVDDQRRRAEADKLRAITELEVRSQQFLVEKQEKRSLEKRIAEMQSQLLGGETSSSVAAIRAEYERKLKSIEAERTDASSSTREVERYKAVLLKQRDIMLGLTSRLRERDERINTLQDEIRSNETQIATLEDALDEKTAELFGIKRAAVKETMHSDLSRTLRDALGGWVNYESGSDTDPKTAGMEAAALELKSLRAKTHSSKRRTSVIRPLCKRLKRITLVFVWNLSPLTAAADAAKCEQLEGKCASYERERTAIRTIIESKISSLATKIAETVDMLPREVKENENSGGRRPSCHKIPNGLADATLNALEEDDRAKNAM